MTVTIFEAARILAERLDIPTPDGDSSPEFRLLFGRKMRVTPIKETLLRVVGDGKLKPRDVDGGYLLPGASISESTWIDIQEAQVALENNGLKFVNAQGIRPIAVDLENPLLNNEPESNIFWMGGSGARYAILLPDEQEKTRRKLERERLNSRFAACVPMWLAFGCWTLEEGCKLLAGIPIRPIEKDSDLVDVAHESCQSIFRHLMLIAKTYKNLVGGTNPAEWIDWFNTSGVSKHIEGTPKICTAWRDFQAPRTGVTTDMVTKAELRLPDSDKAEGICATAKLPGVAKQEILAVKWPLPNGAPTLENILKRIPLWVEEACNRTGSKGKIPHLWNPAMFAYCLVSSNSQKRWKSTKLALDGVIRNHYPEYLSEWEEKSADL